MVAAVRVMFVGGFVLFSLMAWRIGSDLVIESIDFADTKSEAIALSPLLNFIEDRLNARLPPSSFERSSDLTALKRIFVNCGCKCQG